MYLKSAVIIAWLAISYVALIGFVSSLWLAIPVAVSFALAATAVTFNIQHDGSHRAYSDSRWINKLAAMTMDFIGASSYIWRWKHVVYHHTYVNVSGHDTDIDVGFLGRFAPDQPRLWAHRFQHIYMWILYGFMAIRWHLIGDLLEIATGRVGGHRVPRPRGWDLATFIAGKAFSFTYLLVLPLLWHSAWVVIPFYLFVTGLMGVIMSVVVQLAHCVEEAEFPLPHERTGRIENSWAAHQVETTVDFARHSRLVCWFLGGLNFQIEHHLFPRVSHIHYPAIAAIVERVCWENGIRYVAHATVTAGLRSHYRWLRRMGAGRPRRRLDLAPVRVISTRNPTA
jgi:linoleoyl-CoA desaturase